ncbi:MAG: hypothetical protein JXA54_16185 [Candidatus Heimdallarchaeota archaeon]|nr:hypothetical protein [Candidatus Heimdallarchaeota archaeon]
MSHSKMPKDDEYTTDNLIGKHIVDPEGDIIAKCVGIFEDDKKKMRMKISIRTGLDSDFIVKETIPFSLINKIGEVILLKKSVEIQPIAIEDIVTFDILDELSATKEKQLDTPDNNLLVATETEKDNIKTKKDKSIFDEKKQVRNEITCKEMFKEIHETTDSELKNKKIQVLTKKIQTNKAFCKQSLIELFEMIHIPEIKVRLISAEILNEISKTMSDLIYPNFLEIVKSSYNEPSKEVEKLLIEFATNLAILYNSKLLDLQLNEFFNDLLFERKFCRTISNNRIHNINKKIFSNNFEVQELIITKYLQKVLEEKEESLEFAELLSDYNAVLIAYALIKNYHDTEWEKIINSKYLKKTLDQHFIESINNILQHFIEGNMRYLSEMLDPKLGYTIANKIITNMVKFRITDYLSNISILPLEVLTSFFKDDENRTVQIIFDLINKHEIDAQIVFIEDKTYISFSASH